MQNLRHQVKQLHLLRQSQRHRPVPHQQRHLRLRLSGGLLPQRLDGHLRLLPHWLPHLHRQHHQRLPVLQRHCRLLQVHRRGHLRHLLSQRAVQQHPPECQQVSPVLLRLPVLLRTRRQLHCLRRLSHWLLLRARHQQLQDHLSRRQVPQPH